MNSINCEEAHKISIKLRISPKIVGACIDVLNIKIKKCQLGLFDYKNVNKQNQKVKLKNNTTQQLIKHILKIGSNNKLDCKSAWYISKKLNLKKTDIIITCKNLGIKISECQLGIF